MMKTTEEELITYIKPILKSKGFKKKGKRWTKATEHFTYIFYIQGSCYDKDNYYVRPGIIVNDIPASPTYVLSDYGHIFIDIPITTKEEILATAEGFFSEWNDMGRLIETVKEFVAWEERNPVEKRRANEVDYENDPVPSWCLFTMSSSTIERILKMKNN